MGWDFCRNYYERQYSAGLHRQRVPVRDKACQDSAQPVYVSEAPAHGAGQQLCRAHAAAHRHIAQDPPRDQKRGRDEAVWHADDVLPDMGAEGGGASVSEVLLRILGAT